MSDAAAPVVRLRALTHRFGDVTAVDGVDLDVPAGCMAGLIGPDGVGKSTLLGLVAGARRIQHGSAEVLGGDLRARRFREAVAPRIAYMPQGLGGNLYLTLSVRENVDFFARLFGQSGAERTRRLAELLDATGLAPFADRPAGKLSGGMKQKLGLCCALIHDPDLLVLDEPTTGVDPLSRRQFWELIARIRARRPGLGVLVATAYMEEAERFDWLAAMDGGRVLAAGSPAELLRRTGTRDLDAAFVALLPPTRRHGDAGRVVPPRPSDHAEVAIEAHELTVRFGSFTAVDRVSFRIERGEIFGFLGSNGCGKTTTMKMLTGLLAASGGSATILGRPVVARDVESRRRVGYMSQSFSLYGELTVRQNLDLHARLFRVPAAAVGPRVATLLAEFDLEAQADALAADLPLGVRQRLSLAVAIVHQPEILILDEPTSGVDPVARDAFWRLLGMLSRERGVTIFVSTHFMNEGERCDRISLMDAGRVLACDTPAALVRQHGVATLEEAFVAVLRAARGDGAVAAPAVPAAAAATAAPARRRFSLARLLAYARREGTELARDPIRLTFALLGSAVLMVILGYGISLDVDDLRFAVLDRDGTPASRDYVEAFAGSAYFVRHRPIRDAAELERRMRSGELNFAVAIPPGFGRDVGRGRRTTVAVWFDGAMPFRGETIRGYVEGVHHAWLAERARDATGTVPSAAVADVAFRYRYNQDFRSLDAMVPAMIPLLLTFVPAIMMALGVVREKELGSIVNLYVTPVTRLEFLLGKQLPYVAMSMASFATLVALAVFGFAVPLKGSLAALTVAALLYVVVSTGFGLLMSAFTRTQIAALAGTAVITMTATVQFSGLTEPVSSLEGPGAVIGAMWPATYFVVVSRGVFTKALGFADLQVPFAVLAASVPIVTLLAVALLRKQDR